MNYRVKRICADRKLFGSESDVIDGRVQSKQEVPRQFSSIAAIGPITIAGWLIRQYANESILDDV